jgi:hypothetical protein
MDISAISPAEKPLDLPVHSGRIRVETLPLWILIQRSNEFIVQAVNRSRMTTGKRRRRRPSQPCK